MDALPRMLRVLLVPWGVASALFVALTAFLLAFLAGKGLFGLVGSVFLLSWLFKYAFVQLEHVANGHLDPPVVSHEMLGPFETRPVVQLLWCLGFYAALRFLGVAGGWSIVALMLLAMPASVAVLGLGQGVVASFNPLALWRVVRGLGPYYAAIFGVMAVVGGLVLAVGWSGVPFGWMIAVAEVGLLTVFCFIGGALYERRFELGHDPSVSPERQLEAESRAHAKGRDARLEEVYVQVRLRKRALAIEAFEHWLAGCEAGLLARDARLIVDRIATWEDRPFLTMACGRLAEALSKQGLTRAARDVQTYAARYGVEGSGA